MGFLQRESSKGVVPVEDPVERPANRARVATRLVPYEDHALATGAGFTVCLQCKQAFGRHTPRGVCTGVADALPPLVQQLLAAGALDSSIAQGPAALCDLAVQCTEGVGGPPRWEAPARA